MGWQIYFWDWVSCLKNMRNVWTYIATANDINLQALKQLTFGAMMVSIAHFLYKTFTWQKSW